MTRTVFFGPFIGEFAYEIRSWQGWVRKVCLGKYNSCRKIASSYVGRAGLYPDIDEFWPIPKSFEIHSTNSAGYLIKGWRKGFPGSTEVRLVPNKVFRDGQIYVDYQQVESYEAAQGPDIEPLANAMLEDFKQRLPNDAEIITPWQYNKFEDEKLEFGLLPEDHPSVDIDNPLPRSLRFQVREIPPQHQNLGILKVTQTGREMLNELVEPKAELIAVFPRCRKHCASINWPKEKYQNLIVLLQEEFKDSKVAIFGEPGGSYFHDGVPPDTLDLINIESVNRVAVQIAAIERSLFAIGSSSGGLLLPYFMNCPIFKWSGGNEYDLSGHIDSPPLFIYPDMQPEVGEVFKEVLKFWQSIKISD